ncbi:YfdX family protein [Pseudomonadota bacterium]|nr:YfdX family protein [Pseudomonadota bacterium]
MNLLKINFLIAPLFTLALFTVPTVLADNSALPSEPEKQSESVNTTIPKIQSSVTEQTAEKRKKLVADATSALNEANNALKFLEQKKTDEALDALARATGKLELVVARDPKLALAPVNVSVQSFDLFATPETTKAYISLAKELMDDGDIQKVRPLIENLASEVVIRTTNIPLATYPSAIKKVTPLIDDGKIDEAKAALQAALNTLVITDKVIPLPVLRAEIFLEEAEKLAENKKRSDEESDKLAAYLADTKAQLEMADLLGYGDKKAFKPMFKQLREIEQKTEDKSSGKGWFKKIRQQISELVE